jgi:exodeoxyribonuclease VII large subunit
MTTPGKAWTVGALTRALKDLIEDAYPRVWVRGEVSNLRRQPSGHSYFSLKDEDSQLSAVLFRGNAARIDLQLADGQQVLAAGELSVYEPRGNYQLIVRDLLEDGVGRLQRELEATKARLRAEGLFAPERKKSLPELPLNVGVVTSLSGAALRDFLSVLRRRHWRGRVVLFPALVQGASAAAEVAARVEQAARVPGLDLLVLTRGGGSLEDLWSFNDENLARTVAACPLPTLSAIGHETDNVLTDFVADLRKETPTGAAEWISSLAVEARERLAGLGRDLHRQVRDRFAAERESLDFLSERIRPRALRRFLEGQQQRVDEWSLRLDRATRQGASGRRERLALLGSRLARVSPQRQVSRSTEDLRRLHRLLERETGRALEGKRGAVESLLRTLRTGGLEGTLRRGFAVVRDAEDRPLARAAEVVPGARLQVQFADGRVAVRQAPTAGEGGES